MTPIDAQLTQIHAMSRQHYREADEEALRMAYEIDLLRQRIREQDSAMGKIQQWVEERTGK